LAIWAGEAVADFVPFNGSEVAPNIAIVRIEDDAIRIELEIFPRDLRTFEDLLPDEWIPDVPPLRPSEDERWARFAREGLSVSRGDGRPLPLRLERIEPRLRVDRASPVAGQIDPVSGQTVPSPPDDPRVVFAELVYAFDGEKPEQVILRPPPDGDLLPAIIGMFMSDRGVPVTDFRFLPAESTIHIDWHDPWFTRFENQTFQRTQRDSVSTFVYVEPRIVRHETLIRVREVAHWLGIEIKPNETLTPERQAEIAEDAAALLASRNPVTIDGAATSPFEARAETLELGDRGFTVLEDGQDARADAAFVGVILSFPLARLPQNVSVAWDMFSDRLKEVPATIYDAAGPFRSGATPDDPIITWNNHLLTYVEPEVAVVIAPGDGMLHLPLISIAAIAFSLCAAVAAVRVPGRTRQAAIVAGLACLVIAVSARENAVIPIANPLAVVPDDAVALDTVAELLDSVSAAYLLPVADRRREALRAVVTDQSLTDVAAELDRGFAIRVPGGGLARIDAISDLSVGDLTPVEAGYGFQTIAAWTVDARAGHWGHDHRRVVNYRAIIDVVEDAGSWKLEGLTVLEARTPDA